MRNLTPPFVGAPDTASTGGFFIPDPRFEIPSTLLGGIHGSMVPTGGKLTIDRSDSLTRDLVGAFVVNQTHNLANDNVIKMHGGTQLVNSGPYITFNSSGALRSETAVPSTEEWTVYMRGAGETTAAGALFGNSGTSAGERFVGFIYSSSRYRFLIQDGGSNVTISATGDPMPADKIDVQLFGISRANNDHQFYMREPGDGTTMSSLSKGTSNTDISAWSLPPELHLMAMGAKTYSTSSTIYQADSPSYLKIGYIWHRALSTDEMSMVLRNDVQFLIPA